MRSQVGLFSNSEESLSRYVEMSHSSSDEELDYDEGTGLSSGITQKDGQRPGSSVRVEQSLDGHRDQSVVGHISKEQSL